MTITTSASEPFSTPRRVLLLMSAETYRASDFLAAAHASSLHLVVATDITQKVVPLAPGRVLSLPFQDPDGAVQIVREFAKSTRLDGIHAVDEEAVPVASAIGSALNLPTNAQRAAALTCNKAKMRQCLREANVQSPAFAFVFDKDDLQAAADQVGFPCVIKPTFLSASQGVIRADSVSDLKAAYDRITVLIELCKNGRQPTDTPSILVETFVSGREFALEGLLTDGTLRTLALFDKPDPLDGPYFEETLYITPSRAPRAEQKQIEQAAAAGAKALGLHHGAIHAEVRINPSGVWIIEIAARTIGGLCSKAVRFATGMTLEEVILRHAAQLPIPTLERETQAAGVMMLPIPKRGKLRAIHGLDAAKGTDGIEDVRITIPLGGEIVPPPDGRRYLGFAFARASTPDKVETALRMAHAKLRFDIAEEKIGEP